MTLALIVLPWPPAAVRAADDPALIDGCAYPDDAAASAAWRPMAGSPAATAATVDGVPAVRLRCAFSGGPLERASWDRAGRFDLSTARAVQFRIHCRDASPISYFMIYFQSGDGWYSKDFYPETTGWNTVTIDKASVGVEGKPAGWGQVKAIRVSAWRGGTSDTEFALAGMRQVGLLGADSLVAVVRCDSVLRDRPGERRAVETYTRAVAEALEDAAIGYATLSDLDLSADALGRARLVVLPYNPALPDRAADLIAERLRAGGRLITFFGVPSRLQPVVSIESAGFHPPEAPGQFSSLRFDTAALPGVSPVVGLPTRNIQEPKPVEGASRVVASWLDAAGKPTGHAAIVVSDRAAAVSQVLSSDHAGNRRVVLAALVGRLEPEVARRMSAEGLDRIGRFAGYGGFADATAQIKRIVPDRGSVNDALADARRLRDEASALAKGSRHVEAANRAGAAAARLVEAYALAQNAEPGEFRAFWCHSAFGVDGLTWDEAARRLAEGGFTAVLPNMLWGGVAYHDSQVLPVAAEVASRGDQIAECVAACRERGLQVHVWKVNWNLGAAPTAFVDRLRSEGRLQASARGEEQRWLCPSHPANRQLELDAMVEVARKYDVDGLHFDYIRYPDSDHCFCIGCRDRFQKEAGTAVANWPADVLDRGPYRPAYLDWRRSNITALVKAVSERVRAVKPKVKLSAAVFRNWPVDRDGVGQDWKLWCERGWLDFVCPMDYTTSVAQFDNWVGQQRSWAGKTPCYPGIGSFIMTPDRVIEQIQVTRRHGTHGFTVFNYDAGTARSLLPLLGLGTTRETSTPATPVARSTWPFFPFCIDWHDAKRRDFEQQAAMLKELGYGGVGHIWLDKVAERLASLDRAGLKLHQITMTVDLTPGKPPYDPRFEEVLRLVKGRGVQFDLLVSGFKPSDPAGDARAVEVLRAMSDLARDSGSDLLLYPHVNNWIERFDDAARVARKVDRPNVGVMFNLCHWLRVETGRDYEKTLRTGLPWLRAVSINGADAHDDQPGWNRYIQPLDRGDFDVVALLSTLKALGYEGPVGLQCYGIGGDAREHLARSRAAWDEIIEKVGP